MVCNLFGEAPTLHSAGPVRQLNQLEEGLKEGSRSDTFSHLIFGVVRAVSYSEGRLIDRLFGIVRGRQIDRLLSIVRAGKMTGCLV